MDDPEYNPSHVAYQEFACPDGYICTKVPLKQIQFMDLAAVQARVAADPELYARWCDYIRLGRSVVVPVVYRTPKGRLYASDIYSSDVVVYAEQTVQVHAAAPRNSVHPMMGVKLIEVASREDIPVQRAAYLEARQ